MSQFNVTELDFDKIKQNLIDYYKSFPEDKYKDYDFEGSGLNILMDILAYNTHYNAIQAHTSINESFLESAQLRSNVVSRAKLLGYTPNSITAPVCSLTLDFDGFVNDNEDSYTIESGLKVTTSVDGQSYTFVTLSDYTTELNDGEYRFEGVEFYQGVVKTIRNSVKTNLEQHQSYVLRDKSADISTLKVKVYQNSSTTEFDVFKKFNSFTNIEDDSKIYFLSENYDGNYEITFGNDVYGKKPDPQNIIEFEYVSTEGEASNGATAFSWASGGNVPSSILLTSRASGGSPKESIESVRFNAPLTFLAQERAVTADDYIALINRDAPKENISVSAVSVWGGQDNVPPEYGKVFVSVKPKSEEALTPGEKDRLYSLLSSKNVASTIPEIIDPDFTYLYLDIFVKYNSNLTNLSASSIENEINKTVTDYNDTVLEKFNTVFRYSNFLCEIDKTNKSIVSSAARVYAYKTKDLVECDTIPTLMTFDFEIYGDVSGTESLISSDPFTYGDYRVKLADEPLTSKTRRVYAYAFDEVGNRIKVIDDVGVLTPLTGDIRFNPIPVETGDDTIINIYCRPASDDVLARRNTLVKIDTNKTQILADVDEIETAGTSGAIKYTTFNR